MGKLLHVRFRFGAFLLVSNHRISGLMDQQTVAKHQILSAPPTKRSISLCELAQGDSGRIDQLKFLISMSDFCLLTALGLNVLQQS